MGEMGASDAWGRRLSAASRRNVAAASQLQQFHATTRSHAWWVRWGWYVTPPSAAAAPLEHSQARKHRRSLRNSPSLSFASCIPPAKGLSILASPLPHPPLVLPSSSSWLDYRRE